MRLDGEIETSFFILLIPLWVFLVYLSAYLVISGLASTNQRVNKCEKIALSVLVPIGFILTICLGICLLDDLVDIPVYVTFIPLVGSLIFSYLYVRCFFKPTRTDFVKVKPEKNEKSAFESQKQEPHFGQSSMQISQQLA